MDLSQILQVLAQAQHAGNVDQRRLAETLCQEMKAGEPRVSAQSACELATKDKPLEARLFGYMVLQHLVQHRWQEYGGEERRHLANIALGMAKDAASGAAETWAIKCKSSALLAEVLRQEGPDSWGSVLPQLLHGASEGPQQAEMASMVLRWLAEDVTVHNDDILGGKMQLLLKGLLASLPEVLPFLYKLLESHFGSALAAANAQQSEAARLHANVVEAVLTTLQAYADWAPVPMLHQYGILDACAHLMLSVEFRLHAVSFLRQVAVRKKMHEDGAPFVAAMGKLGEALMTTGARILGAPLPDVNSDEFEFVKRFADTFSVFGTQHLATTGDYSSSFLEQLLAFARSPQLLVAAPTIPCWIALLRETQLMAEGKKSSTGVTLPPDSKLPDGARQALLEVSGAHMMTLGDKGCVLLGANGDEPPDGFDTVQEFTEFWVILRSRMLEIIKHVSFQAPLIASQAASWHTSKAISQVTGSGELSAAGKVECLSAVEGAAAFMEAAMPTLSDQAVHDPKVASTINSLMQQLLALQWLEPRLVFHYVRILEGFGHFVGKVCPDSGRQLLMRMFHLLEKLPVTTKPIPCADKDETWHNNYTARQKACSGVLGVAKAGANSLVAYLSEFGEHVEGLWRAGKLRLMERGALCEAMVMVSVAAGSSQQTVTVLDWVFAQVRDRWTDPAWLQNFASPNSFLSFFAGAAAPGVQPLPFSEVIEHQASLISDCHILERTLRRLPPPCSTSTSPATSAAPGPAGAASLAHPFDAHAPWVLPPLMAALRATHSLWTPAGRASVPPHLQEIYCLSPAERAVLMAVGGAERARPDIPAEGSEADQGEKTRDWLKNVRDSGYQILGLVMSHVPNTFTMPGLATAVHQTFLESIEYTENRHLRASIRVVIQSLVLHCPLYPEAQSEWIGALLSTLLPHMLVRLQGEWQKLEGSSNINQPSPRALTECATVSSEVLDDRILRELSRDYLAVLHLLVVGGHGTGAYAPFRVKGAVTSEVANPSSTGGTGNPGQTPGAVAASRVLSEMRPSMLTWLLANPSNNWGLLIAETACHAMLWPDSETAQKAAIISKALAAAAAGGMAGSEVIIRVVTNEMFGKAIQGLTMVSNAGHQGELMTLIRDVLLKLGSHSQEPQRQLMSLPGITPETYQAFQAQITSTRSEKDQRAIIKKLLVHSGGDQLKALASANISTTCRVMVKGATATPEKLLGRSRHASSGAPDSNDPALPSLF